MSGTMTEVTTTIEEYPVPVEGRLEQWHAVGRTDMNPLSFDVQPVVAKGGIITERVVPRGYKWLDKYVHSLDPDVEYAKIIGTLALYKSNEFTSQIDYLVNTIIVVLSPVGAEIMSTTRKAIDKAQKRYEDSSMHFRTWFVNGRAAEATAKRMGQLNGIHQCMAKKCPGNFDLDIGYTSAFCYFVSCGHELQRRIGLPGFDEHVQVAFTNYAREQLSHFTRENSNVDMNKYPDTFDGIIEFADWFQTRCPHEPTKGGHDIAIALRDSMVKRWSPCWIFDPFVRASITFMLSDNCMKTHKMDKRQAWAEAILVFVLRILAFVAWLMPDPKEETYPIFKGYEKWFE